MKVIKSVLALLLCLFCLACKTNDDGNQDPLEGSSNLINVSGGFADIDYDITPGVIVWTFDTSAETMAVVNNDPYPHLQASLPSDTHSYATSSLMPSDNCPQNIIVNNSGNIDCYDVLTNTLSLYPLVSDGF